jgi:hypothetical protein
MDIQSSVVSVLCDVDDVKMHSAPEQGQKVVEPPKWDKVKHSDVDPIAVANTIAGREFRMHHGPHIGNSQERKRGPCAMCSFADGLKSSSFQLNRNKYTYRLRQPTRYYCETCGVYLCNQRSTKKHTMKTCFEMWHGTVQLLPKRRDEMKLHLLDLARNKARKDQKKFDEKKKAVGHRNADGRKWAEAEAHAAEDGDGDEDEDEDEGDEDVSYHIVEPSNIPERARKRRRVQHE